MPKLTDQIKLSGLNYNDIVHIARPTDLSQSANGSSYKATIGQLLGAENCCITSGVFVSSASTLNLYEVTNDLAFSVSGLTIFSGGSEICSKVVNFSIASNNVWPCVDNLNVQPISTNGNRTLFGSNNGISGLTVQQIINPAGTNAACSPTLNFGYTRVGLNVTSIQANSTIELRTFNRKGSYSFYDRLCGASNPQFRDVYQIFLYVPTAIPVNNPTVDNTIGTAFKSTANNQAGLICGALNTNDSTNGDYGTSREGFISTIYSANGINFVSRNSSDTAGHISFYLGTDYSLQPEPNIHINGTGSTKGFMGIGRTNVDPTSLVDILSTVSGNNYEQLRLRTQYTPTGGTDSNGNIGDISWDDGFLYIKSSISPHTWNRLSLSTF